MGQTPYAHLLAEVSTRKGMKLAHSAPTWLLPPPRPAPPVFWARPIKAETEIRVCVNRTCSRSGSRQVLQVLSDLAPAAVRVISCGCLGRCGAGPNLAILPEGAIVGHCGTAARAAELLAEVCGGAHFDASKGLESLALRKQGEAELERHNFAASVALFSQAIDLKPSGGLHSLYKCRSVARLEMGDAQGALEDAEDALILAPMYPEAYICQGDAFMSMEQLDAAERAYSTALQIDPSLRRSKSFKARVVKLEERFAVTNVLA